MYSPLSGEGSCRTHRVVLAEPLEFGQTVSIWINPKSSRQVDDFAVWFRNPLSTELCVLTDSTVVGNICICIYIYIYAHRDRIAILEKLKLRFRVSGFCERVVLLTTPLLPLMEKTLCTEPRANPTTPSLVRSIYNTFPTKNQQVNAKHSLTA